MKEVTISEFKATCLALIKQVRRTGQPILITLRGEPIAEVVPARRPTRQRGWLGSARGTGEILGDVVGPIGERWDSLADDR